MMDQMDEILIECDELRHEEAQGPTTTTAGHRGLPPHHLRGLPAGVHRSTPDRQTSSDGGLTTAIMMYSPDIPSAEGKGAYDTRPKLADYYASIEAEETVKCVVSTALFLAIVVAIILVTILENPQM